MDYEKTIEVYQNYVKEMIKALQTLSDEHAKVHSSIILDQKFATLIKQLDESMTLTKIYSKTWDMFNFKGVEDEKEKQNLEKYERMHFNNVEAKHKKTNEEWLLENYGNEYIIGYDDGSDGASEPGYYIYSGTYDDDFKFEFFTLAEVHAWLHSEREEN